jgi:uncharacterized protein YidB (DUF937 family)
MSRGLPSMTALLGLIAVAGYQHRDKLAELFGGSSQGTGGSDPSSTPQAGGITGMLGSLGSLGTLGGLLGGTGSPDPSATQDNPALAAQQTAGLGTGLGSLAGLVGGANANSVLSNGISELMDRFKQNGHGAAAESWVGSGDNHELAPEHLEQAIGPDVLATLSQQTGLSREDLLARLSKELPNAVDKYTPDGQVPTPA